jgi:hypothetical protein
MHTVYKLSDTSTLQHSANSTISIVLSLLHYHYMFSLRCCTVDLGGLVVSVLAGSIPTEVDGFLRVIKIRSTTSFGGTSNARKRNSAAISHPSLLTDCQMALALTSGLSRTARPVDWSLTATNAQDPVTSERGGPSPCRAVEPWLLLLYYYRCCTTYFIITDVIGVIRNFIINCHFKLRHLRSVWHV